MKAKFDNYILWAQSKSSTGSDILVVDGIKIENDLGTEEFEYITSFPSKESNSWKPVLKNYLKDNPSIPLHKGLSPKLEILKNGDGNILIKSHYNSTDENERRIAFIFCSKGKNFAIAANRLVEASHVLNLTPNTKDIQLIKNIQFLKYIKISSLIILLIILILWLIKNYLC